MIHPMPQVQHTPPASRPASPSSQSVYPEQACLLAPTLYTYQLFTPYLPLSCHLCSSALQQNPAHLASVASHAEYSYAVSNAVSASSRHLLRYLVSSVVVSLMRVVLCDVVAIKDHDRIEGRRRSQTRGCSYSGSSCRPGRWHLTDLSPEVEYISL